MQISLFIFLYSNFKPYVCEKLPNMILNINITNYRSFKDRKVFTMIAESSNSKDENVFYHPIGKNENIKLLKTSLIFGSNASGKTTLLRAMFELRDLIVNSKITVGNEIKAYDPFRFSEETKNAPVEFTIEFIIKSIKYKYEIIFERKNVIKESLIYYPNNRTTTLFTRDIPDDNENIMHIGYIGAKSKNKTIKLFHNQFMLSKFGTDIPNEIISEVFLYFKNISVINSTNATMLTNVQNQINVELDKNPTLLNKVNELIRLADTGVNRFNIEKNNVKINLPDKNPNDAKNKVIVDVVKYQLTGFHDFFKGNKLVHSTEPLPFDDESNGTKAFFIIGAKLIKVLEKGIPIFIDELETSLHPFLTSLLISLFQNKHINRKNAQLIFTSHETNLLDRKLFRKDQIWFTEKDNTGNTDLYSLQDYSDVREDTPFDKWYLAGKFGGIPNIKSLENLFVDNDE